jgi:hypothetical protein
MKQTQFASIQPQIDGVLENYGVFTGPQLNIAQGAVEHINTSGHNQLGGVAVRHDSAAGKGIPVRLLGRSWAKANRPMDWH